MTPETAATIFVSWVALASFAAGLAAARAALWLGNWTARHREQQRRQNAIHNAAVREYLQNRRMPGKATNTAVAERDAYRAEVALMARSDAGKTANAMAAMLQARVSMRMSGGNHGG